MRIALLSLAMEAVTDSAGVFPSRSLMDVNQSNSLKLFIARHPYGTSRNMMSCNTLEPEGSLPGLAGILAAERNSSGKKDLK